jgi:hypothetical protein
MPVGNASGYLEFSISTQGVNLAQNVLNLAVLGLDLHLFARRAADSLTPVLAR